MNIARQSEMVNREFVVCEWVKSGISIVIGNYLARILKINLYSPLKRVRQKVY